MLVTLNACCQGSSHIKDGKPCQDSCESFKDSDNYLGLAIVADGHGGEKYIRSDIGSREAVFRAKIFVHKLLRNHIDAYIKRKDKESLKKNFDLLKSQIVSEWRDAVTRHQADNCLTEDEKNILRCLGQTEKDFGENNPELYGTTLLIAGYIEKYSFWFALQIGDGKIALLKNDGSIAYPIPDLDEQGFGVTNSLCNSNAADKIQYVYAFEKIAGITVMTDGMSDSFDLEKLPKFLTDIKDNALIDVKKTQRELDSYLPKLSEQGSGDDISIAGVFVKENGLPVVNNTNKGCR
ncbi:MAG: protein phosphatase 2C domain-containing protein [Treponema sp.]|nr:protein phosphatase 2C domain-containing protein [Treponema sp.]